MSGDESARWDNPYFVSWEDDGRRVDVSIGGAVQHGSLCVDDMDDIDGEEVPVFSVILDDGRKASFVVSGKWRFSDQANTIGATP